MSKLCVAGFPASSCLRSPWSGSCSSIRRSRPARAAKSGRARFRCSSAMCWRDCRFCCCCRASGRRQPIPDDEADAPAATLPGEWLAVAITVGGLVVYGMLLEPFGFIPSTAFMVAVVLLFGLRVRSPVTDRRHGDRAVARLLSGVRQAARHLSAAGRNHHDLLLAPRMIPKSGDRFSDKIMRKENKPSDGRLPSRLSPGVRPERARRRRPWAR